MKTPSGFVVEYQKHEEERPRQSVSCKHCGLADLQWGLVEEKWRLFESPEVQHDCPAFKRRHGSASHG